MSSLLDLIAAKNGSSGHSDNVAIQTVTPESSAHTDATPNESSAKQPAQYWNESPPFEAYDPIAEGVIDEEHAYRLVKEFQNSFVLSFPFIVIDGNGPVLRRNAPFLLLAVLTVTAYKTPRIQCVLAEELRRQMARNIEHSQKSLEILQGLLVYGAWYHTFYRPANQQLAIIVQLCVALVQDLGLSSTAKVKLNKWSIADCGIVSRSQGSLAEKRAYLGTYFLAVLFSQSWRRRTTLPYTRYMQQCCDSFSESSVPTDALIRPLTQASELLSRVNAHFSYDDLENAEIKGEMLLDMSVTSFVRELSHIKASPGVTILMRSNSESLGLHSWATWFYAVIVVCKLVFLQENERLGRTHLEDIPDEIDNLIPQNMNAEPLSEYVSPPPADGGQSGWNALSVAREYGIRELFERCMDKLRFILPEGDLPWHKPKEERESLYALACIQQVMLNGYNKRIDRLTAGPAITGSNDQSTSRMDAQDATQGLWQHSMSNNGDGHANAVAPVPLAPYASFMNFDAINFDGIMLPTSTFPPQFGEEVLGDWIWNLAMDEFTMP
ncbi:hypothetical protein FB567DRAFT_560770 [Paraphoma chrysanthemicola]|uniref:Transcription factor domain-containing protein n=1 Tax=Paraphoma chrysanthemicola TaxID=798071 RepID=A0A8K0R3S9_9PLEO|nr:hypothetical protein FB567DRAFT_560770 [Paraphoma chrysanthemicola]